MIRKGAYALFLHLPEDVTMDVGSLGQVSLERGTYCYIGSAMNGLDQRISRHLRREKKIRWHIDRLTTIADKMEAYETSEIKECELRDIAEECGMIPSVKGFGCSDCGCRTHLLSVSPRSREMFISSARLVRTDGR